MIERDSDERNLRSFVEVLCELPSQGTGLKSRSRRSINQLFFFARAQRQAPTVDAETFRARPKRIPTWGGGGLKSYTD